MIWVWGDEVREVTKNHIVQGFIVQNNNFVFYSKNAGKPLDDLCRREKYFYFPTFYNKNVNCTEKLNKFLQWIRMYPSIRFYNCFAVGCFTTCLSVCSSINLSYFWVHLKLSFRHQNNSFQTLQYSIINWSSVYFYDSLYLGLHLCILKCTNLKYIYLLWQTYKPV